MPFYTSRSAIREYHRCPRARYYQYHHDGTGIVPTRQSIPLVVGGSVHVGLESLLRGEELEVACERALLDYMERTAERGFNLTELEDSHYVYHEQKALTEALIRAFYYRGLGPFLEEYEVLELEREVPLELFPEGILETRADGVLLKRSDISVDLFPLSWKTANVFDKRREKDSKDDDQGLSETAALNARLYRLWRHFTFGESIDAGDLPENQKFFDLVSAPMSEPLKCAGVQMVHLIKGKRNEYPEGSGLYEQSSHLIRPWTRDSFPAPEYAWSWKFTDSKGNHTLGKGWRKCAIWERMPVREWIEMLAEGRIQPEAGDPLSSVIVMPPPIRRRPEEIEDWVEQAATQERRIAGFVHNDPKVRPENRRRFLNQTFPQHRRSCHYPGPCNFLQVCFGPAGEAPLETGIYERRQPHHKGELESFNE